MGIIKMQHNVPDIYNTSRDFQLIERLYDLPFNSACTDAESIEDITSTQNIRSNLIPLLAKKVGWFSDKVINTEDWRQALIAFPYLLKNKGSRKAIEDAVYLFLNIYNIRTEATIEIITKDEDYPYTVKISIDADVVNTTILETIFDYILPVGWLYDIDFVHKFEDYNTQGAIEHTIDNVSVITIEEAEVS